MFFSGIGIYLKVLFLFGNIVDIEIDLLKFSPKGRTHEPFLFKGQPLEGLVVNACEFELRSLNEMDVLGKKPVDGSDS